MAENRIMDLTALAQKEDACQLKEALKNEDQESHFAILGEIVKHSANMRKEDPSLPGISIANISDKSSSDQLLSVNKKMMYKRSFGDSASQRFANFFAGDIPAGCDK